jgi:ABC-type lipoprotein release transport system permease subunit
MIMLIKMAWRNILRNKRRTVISTLAISMGLTALIFLDAFMNGMTVNMIKSATSSFIGEAQVHFEGFNETMEIEKTIKNSGQLVISLQKEPEIKTVSPRTRAFGMVSSAANMHSVMIVGVHPDMEKNISKLDDAIVEGTYLEKDDERGIVVGSRVADILEVELEDRIVVTVAQAGTGEMSQEMLRVKGIFKTGIREIDGNIVLVPIKISQNMLALEGEYHEIAVNFKEFQASWDDENFLWEKYSTDGNLFRNWRTLLPEMKAMIEMSAYSMFIIAFVLFLLVAGVIVNTMFMTIYERMFEFGVIKAIGEKPLKVGALIVVESGFIAVLASIAGSIFAVILNIIFTKFNVFDFSGSEFMSVTITEKIDPVMTLQQYTVYPLALILFTMIVGIYPAIHAARINPSVAIKKGQK